VPTTLDLCNHPSAPPISKPLVSSHLVQHTLSLVATEL
jgi:hypothetical protein